MARNEPRPIRILHVLHGMNCGGVETWLMNVLRNIDRQRFQFDIFVQTQNKADYDDEIEQLGLRVIRGASRSRPLRFAKSLRQVLTDRRPYDVIHSHVYSYSGWVLRQAASAGVPIRIVHSHTTRSLFEPRPILRRWYEAQQRRWIQKHATLIVSAVPMAITSLLGPRWRHDPRCKTMAYGLDLTRFHDLPEKSSAKTALGIPVQRRVIGHVGRLSPEKNHSFLIRVFHHLVSSGVDAHLLLVGNGLLRQAVEKEINHRNLAGRCTLAGSQADVAPYFAAMDLFLFPSNYEGLGLAAIEAQAAGLPCIVSDRVPAEIAAVPGFVRWLPLKSAAQWSQLAAARLLGSSRRDRDPAEMLSNSRFGLTRCLNELAEMYTNGSCGDAPIWRDPRAITIPPDGLQSSWAAANSLRQVA